MPTHRGSGRTRKTKADAQREEEGFYAVYSDYTKTLRTWLVAYGVGGPVLFVTQDMIAKPVIESGKAFWIVCLFLVGVAAQVFIALVNKYVNWYLYNKADPTQPRNENVHRRVDWLSERIGLDVSMDIISIVAFGWATAWVLLIFTDC